MLLVEESLSPPLSVPPRAGSPLMDLPLPPRPRWSFDRDRYRPPDSGHSGQSAWIGWGTAS
eukprot:16081237-Heterocapsa_arctica.AAC.1